jgi:hypothetical protein
VVSVCTARFNCKIYEILPTQGTSRSPYDSFKKIPTNSLNILSRLVSLVETLFSVRYEQNLTLLLEGRKRSGYKTQQQ